MGKCSFVFFCFFATLFRKDIVEWNKAMSHKSNIFPNQNAPSHKKIQNMKTKKTKQFNVKKKFSTGIYSILGIFENTETQIYRIISICGIKASFIDLTEEANAHSIACRRTMPALRENLSAHYQLKHVRKKKTTRKRKKNKQKICL